MISYWKPTEFSVTHGEAENIKRYIGGSIKDMQSLLTDVSNNIPFEEEKFTKVEDDRVSLRCNFRRVCKPSLETK